eukprot:gene13924-16449_t
MLLLLAAASCAAVAPPPPLATLGWNGTLPRDYAPAYGDDPGHLDLATGELTSHVRFGAKDGGWSATLLVTQLISQTVPSLGTQRAAGGTARRNESGTKAGWKHAIQKLAYGLPGAVYNDTTPAGIFGEGTPYVVSVVSNSGSKVAMAVATRCDGAAPHAGRDPERRSSGGG